jgi:2-oxoglutarate dehydrogenase complex dehydrogenase (E1) component-like enzyme
MSVTSARVTRVLFLSGKLYYELAQHRGAKEYWCDVVSCEMRCDVTARRNTALIRLEELSPFPYPAVREALAAYPNASSFYWCQEEHQNGGAWRYPILESRSEVQL